MSATLDQIDNALFAALSTLSKQPPTSGPFAFVGRWAGALPNRDDLENQEGFGAPTAALLASLGEAAKPDMETLAGDREDQGAASWTVLVALQEPRGAKQVAKGGADAKGMLWYIDQVIVALNGTQVPAPAGIVTVGFQGTPSTLYQLAGLTLSYNLLVFTPQVASVMTDGGGIGSFTAITTGPATALGNVLPLTPLTWSATPSGVTTTTVTSEVLGIEGTIRNLRVRYTGWRWQGLIPGRIAVAGVQFTAFRSVPTALPDDGTYPYQGTTGNIHLFDGPSPTPSNSDPIDIFKDR